MEVEVTPESETRLKQEPQDLTDASTSSDSASVFLNQRIENVECFCTYSQVKFGSLSNIELVSSNSSSQPVIGSNSSPRTNRNCCIKQRLCTVLNSGLSNDVMFIVGGGKEKQKIPAIKAILSASSEVFSAMFSKNWSAKSAEIEVPDLDPSIFTALIRFLYTDEVSVTADNVMGMLYAARKYDVEPLESRCVVFLVNNLCPSNAFTILNQASVFNDQKLVNLCLKEIDKNTAEAIAADDFCDVDAKTLCLVLERNTLTIKEIELFKAVLRWSEAECRRKSLVINQENRRSVANEAVLLLRFLLMSPEEFQSEVASSNFLTNDELLSLSLHYLGKSKHSISCTPRYYSEFTVNRFQEVEGGFPSDGCRDGINFTCAQDVVLLGVGLYGSTKGPTSYKVIVSLRDTASHVLCEINDVYQSDGTSVIYKALFRKPVKLAAFNQYTVITLIKGPDSFGGKKGLTDVTVDLPHNRRIKVSFSTRVVDNIILRTGVDRGQIPELIFST